MFNEQLNSNPTTSSANDLVTSVCFLQNGNVLSGDEAGTVKIWDANAGNCLDMLMNDNPHNDYRKTALNCMQLSPVNPNFLSAGFSDGSLACWDLNRTDKIATRHQNIHSSRISAPDRDYIPGICALAYSPRNYKLIATAGHDGKVALIDTLTAPKAEGGSNLSTTISVGGAATALAFSEDAVHTAVGTDTGKILVFDWRSVRSPVCSIDAHGPNPIYSLAFQVKSMER